MSEWEGLIRLAVAAAIGGAIGFERETLDKSAGLRTHMLVCLGAAMFMVSSILLVDEFGTGPELVRVDPSRIVLRHPVRHPPRSSRWPRVAGPARPV